MLVKFVNAPILYMYTSYSAQHITLNFFHAGANAKVTRATSDLVGKYAYSAASSL